MLLSRLIGLTGEFFFGHFDKLRRFHKSAKIQPFAVILKFVVFPLFSQEPYPLYNISY